MGSQGILKSTNAGASWTVLGANVFGDAYTEPAGNFPQYDAVGKVAVDPNNSNNVVAGTKKGLWFSYDGGNSWAGPCVTNSFTTQRQDITGLVLSNMGNGTTRILAAVGVRGFATPVQYDLGNNGANGLYSGTMGTSGCPSFTSLTTNANGFNFGTAVTKMLYTTGANMNADSGSPYVSATSGDQLGRIDIGVAPSNPNVIYAQVQAIAPNNDGSSACGNTAGCQLGAWVSTDGGNSWNFMTGSAGASLEACASSGAGSSSTAGGGDYPQNWYDQGVAVDPNNPDRVFFDTFDIWLATRTGTQWYDTSCAYTQTTFTHADEHALAFVPGSSSELLVGNDGGTDYTLNANAASLNTARPTWANNDGGLDTIEYYNGDIWGGSASTTFAQSTAPWAEGGAQDNMDSIVHFSGSPTGPVNWQGNVGGDGFWAAIDGKGGYMYLSNNSGALHRCVGGATNCAGTGSVFGSTDIRSSTMKTDQQSFVEPFDLFRGNIGGSGNAECGTRSNHLMVGTYRVWETIASDATGTVTWTARTPDLTKESLGNRSYINQLHYAPLNQTLGIVATNDGNVQVLYNLGGAAGTAATNVNLTGGNAVLPNRPILDARFDPGVQNTAQNPMMGYAAVGGFDANTPSQPGHVFEFTCNVNCASFTWVDKTGNLPDIAVDSIMPNPNFPQQVFAGTDFGLYFTNDITAASPTWYKFQNGLPSAMIWSMQTDRGNSTLSIWTRSRGAYVWPLPTSAIKQNQTIAFGSLSDATYGDPDFNVSATASSGQTVTFGASGNCTVTVATVHITGAGSCTITASQGGDIDYNAAPDVPQTFAIAKAAQTITFNQPPDHTYGDPDFDPGATASSGDTVTYAASGNCTIVSNLVHITGAGSCTVTASQGGDSNYNAASDVPQTFAINKADQSITFANPGTHTYGDADFDPGATASSGDTVSYGASGDCSIVSSLVHITGAGSCTVTASQGGDSNYNAASDVPQTFSISKAAQTIQITTHAPSSAVYGDSFTVAATSGSGDAVAYGTSGVCSNNGADVTITGSGTCTVTYDQAGDSNYNAAPQKTDTVSVRAQQLNSGSTACNGTFVGTTVNVVVHAGATCGLLPGTVVKSNVTVKPGGTLFVSGATIGGDLLSSGDASVCSSKIGRDVVATGGTLTLGGQGCGNTIKGNVAVTNDADDVSIVSNTIRGGLTVKKLSGANEAVDNNTVSGNLLVGHSGPIDVSGNHAFNAKCSNDTGLTGSGNKAKGTNSCPA